MKIWRIILIDSSFYFKGVAMGWNMKLLKQHFLDELMMNQEIL
jgi:hypothetical protein